MPSQTKELALKDLRVGMIVRAREDVYFPRLGARLPTGEPWLLVVLEVPHEPFNASFPELRIAPLAESLEFATDLDVVCRAADSTLERAFRVEVWNQRAMLLANVESIEGALSDEALQYVFALNNALVGIPTDPLPSHWVGKAITRKSDARYQYQQQRVVEAAFLSSPADQLVSLACEAAEPDRAATVAARWEAVDTPEQWRGKSEVVAGLVKQSLEDILRLYTRDLEALAEGAEALVLKAAKAIYSALPATGPDAATYQPAVPSRPEAAQPGKSKKPAKAAGRVIKTAVRKAAKKSKPGVSVAFVRLGSTFSSAA